MPRLLDVDQVREIDAFLQSLSRDELTRRCDARRMTELEIYPDAIWMRADGWRSLGVAIICWTPSTR